MDFRTSGSVPKFKGILFDKNPNQDQRYITYIDTKEIPIQNLERLEFITYENRSINIFNWTTSAKQKIQQSLLQAT